MCIRDRVLGGVGACKRTEQPTTTDTWKRFSSSAGRFSVLLPANPVERVDTITVHGRSVTVHRFQTDLDRQHFFEVDYGDFLPEGAKPRDYFDELEQLFLSLESNKNSRVIFRQEFELAGYPGREIEVERTGGQLIRWKIVAVNGRVYQFGAGRPLADRERGDVTLFFGSFELAK